MNRLLLSASAAVLALSLSACGGDDSSSPVADDTSPQEVMELAKTTLDETSGVEITLAADNLTASTGIRKATGIGVPPGSFEGSFDLTASGLPATAEVIAVDGKVYARNSLLIPDWTAIDPAQFGAPDPGKLMGPDAGFSSLLTSTTDLERGDQVRGGANNDEVLTSYSGSVPGDVVANIVPTASGDFDASYTISDDGELREATLTGVFYEDDGEMTYTITFDDYGTEKDITAP